jgi:hypothetical protein
LKVENTEAKTFVSSSELVLIVVGFLSSSSVVYAAISVLAIAALIVYVVWSLHSPIVVVRRGR